MDGVHLPVVGHLLSIDDDDDDGGLNLGPLQDPYNVEEQLLGVDGAGWVRKTKVNTILELKPEEKSDGKKRTLRD